MCKRILFCLLFVFSSRAVFTQAITLKIDSYTIDGRQTAALYEKAELLIEEKDEMILSWQIILYRKNAGQDTIRLERLDPNIGRGIGVFRKVTIQEGGKTSSGLLFASIPPFDNDKIQILFRHDKNESIKRRLILS